MHSGIMISASSLDLGDSAVPLWYEVEGRKVVSVVAELELVAPLSVDVGTALAKIDVADTA